MKLNNKDIYKIGLVFLGGFKSFNPNSDTAHFDTDSIPRQSLNYIKKASDQDIKNFLDKQLEAKLESIRLSNILLEIEEKVQAYQKQLMDEAGI